ncbi:hypothetical protein AC578_10348 [Pseudocercospora eumusae]|uniref:Zn(2)-C6 fungal-type domain-containing protein n=1 Tax=Pseudocercospora eumusae TaxID=321146 RepID=A0A139HRP5_9PEZI|nr:hypothetical protein AC578_10348 [Pseudocercospora eumusae]
MDGALGIPATYATPNGNSNSNSNSYSNSYSNVRPPSQGQKRRRAKHACEPCRLRKRRCNGNEPCNMCAQFEYRCYFEKHPRKRSKIVDQHAIADAQLTLAHADIKAEPGSNGPTTEDLSKIRALEANSGIAFTRLLGMKLDPSSGGPKLFTFGWNLGTSTYQPPPSVDITTILDRGQMLGAAQLFFQNVHPIYGFLDQEWINQGISQRWITPEECAVPDHILCGVAAIGILFSPDGTLVPVLPRLVDAQKQALESTSTMQPPNLMDVQSWILRCLTLRVTDHPHATWIATCTTMHLVESVGLQLEASTSVLHPAANDSNNLELRRRAFWIARMLNSWVSFEYGRTRVALRGITAQLPTSGDGDYTTDYINLYSISCCLDPEQSDSAGQWEEFLSQLDAYEPPHDGIALSKANLALCGYRRLRLANPNLSPDVINKIINIGLGGLDAARRMAEQGMPWWHVANVPFQVICVFLAMDGRESLSHLSTAMRTLEFVVERFHTVAMKEALKTARFLVRLSKRRKDEDSEVLGLSLQKAAAEDPAPENTEGAQPQQQIPNGSNVNNIDELPIDSATASSNEEWNLDMLESQFESQFDWNSFFMNDTPDFGTIAPDGTM